jgi:hypothetical protein
MAVWKLQNGEEEIPGRLVIVNREFRLTNYPCLVAETESYTKEAPKR